MPDRRKALQGKKKNCSHQGINIPLVAVSVSFDFTDFILVDREREVNQFWKIWKNMKREMGEMI